MTEKEKELEEVKIELDEVDPEKLRLADLWYMKRILVVARR